jgi:hypothetical protein
MRRPKMQALGLTLRWSPRGWDATGDIDGVVWLEA